MAVGSTGRVGADGSLQLTGGGDLNLRVGGALNPEGLFVSGHLNGAVINLRGTRRLTAAPSVESIFNTAMLSQHSPQEKRGPTTPSNPHEGLRPAA